MAGCFGGSTEDRYFESQLNSYLDAGGADEYAFEEAERVHGACIYEDGDLYIFEDGYYGCPTMVEDADEDGSYMSLGGLKEGYLYETKDGGYLFKAFTRVPSKRISPKRWYGKTKKVVQFFIRIEP